MSEYGIARDLKRLSAFWTVIKILVCHVATVCASLSRTFLTSKMQILRLYFTHSSSGDSVSQTFVYFIARVAAACFNKIPFVPLNNRDKKQAKAHIGYINIIASIFSTLWAYDSLLKFKTFLNWVNPKNKKHFSPSLFLLNIRQNFGSQPFYAYKSISSISKSVQYNIVPGATYHTASPGIFLKSL